MESRGSINNSRTKIEKAGDLCAGLIFASIDLHEKASDQREDSEQENDREDNRGRSHDNEQNTFHDTPRYCVGSKTAIVVIHTHLAPDICIAQLSHLLGLKL